MGHLHLTVKDVDAHQKFWAALGGTPVQNGPLALIQFPGTYVMLRKAEPAGGTVGSTINHVGFLVKDIAPWIAKWQAAGLKMEPQARPTQVYLIAPDDVRVEILEDKTIDAPLKMHHVHFYIGVAARDAGLVREDVRRHAGKARPVRRRRSAGRQPDVREGGDADRGTKGRSLDHIGFEVKGLEAFCKKLEAAGIKLDRPYTKISELRDGDRVPDRSVWHLHRADGKSGAGEMRRSASRRFRRVGRCCSGRRRTRQRSGRGPRRAIAWSRCWRRSA